MADPIQTNTSLQQPATPDGGAVALLAELVAGLRPSRPSDVAMAVENFHALIRNLDQQDGLRDRLKQALRTLFNERGAVLLFATSGIYPETGLIVETLRRLSHKLLPEAPDEAQLKDVFLTVFQPGDAGWVEAIAVEDWMMLISALRFDDADASAFDELYANLLEALRVVSHRIAASGLEPEMLRLYPALELHESPFLAQCEEALDLAEHAGQAQCGIEDIKHYLVLIDQCNKAIEQVRRRAQQQGASFYLTFRLRRLQQYLERASKLSGLATIRCGRADTEALEQTAALCRELTLAECRRNDLLSFWGQNLELMALRISENAGHAGEHYISETRAEYFDLLRSALGGGFIIAFMAANKIWLGTLGLPPLTEVLAFCLNYAFGFVFIHILHFSVATKQPAMTANAIAAAIGESNGRKSDMEPLAELVARTIRSQLAAIVGNVSLAFPIAMLIGLAVQFVSGEHFISPDKAQHLLADIDPVGSGAILYAAITGVCLFLAGLIAGYYDNLCDYNRIPQRLLRLKWPVSLFGAARWQRAVGYIENNLGALAGNFAFGFLLGGAAGLGFLLGLPIDIRHIAFSSSYWGFSMIGLEFNVQWTVAVLAAIGVLAIGLTNLVVSFYLAMWVGLKARGVTFNQRRDLIKAVLSRLWRRPREFFLPDATDTPR
ncbi:MAG: site-specific recombinase [Gallionella sp.]